jgi:hypothetical protein
MTEQSLAEFLNGIDASSDTIQQGFRYYLAERTDDLPSRRMEQELISASADERAFLHQLSELEKSSEQLEEIALLCLSEAWESPDERDAIRIALKTADEKLPIVETTVIAICAMYGMYLSATGGKQSVHRRVRRREDGTYEEEETVKYADPKPWIGGIVRLFRPTSGE